MSLALEPHRDAVVMLYTVSKMSLRAIGDRYRCSGESVRSLLIREGVSLRDPAERSRVQHVQAIHDEEEEIARKDDLHVRSIVRALKGRGFPFYPEGRLNL